MKANVYEQYSNGLVIKELRCSKCCPLVATDQWPCQLRSASSLAHENNVYNYKLYRLLLKYSS